ncbi:MAG: ferredoxin [Gemmatimonadetes bacterium]|nr:MAG: ferredoxin [Gemmatimonadota bacterium]
MDHQDPRAHPGGAGQDGRPGSAARPLGEHDGQDDLRAVGLVRRARRLRDQEVQKRVRGLHRRATQAGDGGVSDELINLTIDGVPVSVPKGTLVIEAAKQAGVLVPHYCYHPGLPVAGVCRMCLVEIEKQPKLAISCATQAAEGMVVNTQSAAAKSARTGVLEFLLINHPLDCPICDQAGECELQDFTFQEGRAGTRYSPDYPKRFNPVEDFGPDVLYVPNRCILCTRCVRFMEDVAQEPVLNVSERGDRAYIGVHPETRLDHPWAGNVVDLCPVGSLLSKDFLHKARAWELDKTASVCTGCSQGCNVTLDTRENVVVRVRPRPNLEVNRYFICDHGRMNYRWMNRGDRIEAPLVRRGGELHATDWQDAFERVTTMLRGAGPRVVALASPRASTEALFFARELFRGLDWTGAFQVVMGEEASLAGVPDLALRAERAPNGRGAELLGYGRDYAAALAAAESAAVVLVLDEPDIPVRTAGALIYAGTVLPERARDAEVVLPIVNVAEEDGCFVNRDGRVQRYAQAKPAPGMARPGWWVFSELGAALGHGEPVGSAAEAFERVAQAIDALRGLSYEQLGFLGKVAAAPVAV